MVNGIKRNRIVDILAHKEVGKEATVYGWIRTRRDSKGGFSFLEINDGSCVKNLQVIADKRLPNYEDEVLKLNAGASVKIKGTLVNSPGKKQDIELIAEELKVVGWADPERYPLQKKRHSFEFLRSIPHLRGRTNTFGAVARVRSAISYAIHKFFQERGFIYIHTPIITGNDCEGAGEVFKVTAFDLANMPTDKDGSPDYSEDFFGQKAYLTVSGQLEAEAYALALGDVYTFGPTFRADNSNTPRHLAEFWMVEPEMAFSELDRAIKVAEEFLRYLFSFVLEECKSDIEFFNRFVESNLIRTLEEVREKGFSKISYTEAIDMLSKSKRDFQYPVEWGLDLKTEHERYICEEVFYGPTVITDYPKGIRPFYMKLNPDNKTVRAMDVLVPGIGEIIGGSQREDDYYILVQRMEEQGIDPRAYWWYLELRRFGSTPHAGFGLGFDRFIQFITGLSNIRDVIPFPRTPGSLGFLSRRVYGSDI